MGESEGPINNSLHCAAARFNAIFERAGLGIALCGLDGKIITGNPAIGRMLGYSVDQLTGKHYSELTHPEDLLADAELSERLLRGEIEQFQIEKRYIRSDGAVVWGELTVTLISGLESGAASVLGMVQDITERKRAEQGLRESEEKLRHAQKMEAVGQLAGGIAHDFNNLLTVIMGYSALLQNQLPVTDHRRAYVSEIANAGENGTKLTRQLLAFSRKQMLQPRQIEVNGVVLDAEKMLCRVIGEDIRLVTVLDPNAGFAHFDPGQLCQVMLNLAVNARDAMPRGGELVIETAKVALDEVAVKRLPDLKAGDYIRVSVRDTGSGIPKHVKSRVFEPFFTTKASGKGSGLGLSMVHGVLKQSGGEIEVESEVGFGTTFRLYLPRIGQSVTETTDRQSVSDLPPGSETVLVVEDEKSVRTLVAAILRQIGYAILQAESGEDAIRICQEYPDAIDLMVTDLVMPQMGGRELSEAAVRLRPDMKVLYLSGYSDDSVIRHGLDSSQIAFLQKPFGPHALAIKVREVLCS